MKAELIDRMGSDKTILEGGLMKAIYKSHMGDDDFVCDMARVSFRKEASQFSKERNEKLIQYLAKHNHWAPFGHPQITIYEEVPIFVAAQRMKHVVGFVYNSVSRRYVDDEPEFYVPDVWRSRPDGSVKQGSGEGSISHVPDPAVGEGRWYPIDKAYTEFLEQALYLYKNMIDGGVAPEQARMVLPQSMYTSYYVTGSLAAFARFYKQRIDDHAQKEIQELAKQVGDIIQPLYPVSWKALVEG